MGPGPPAGLSLALTVGHVAAALAMAGSLPMAQQCPQYRALGQGEGFGAQDPR